MESDFELLKSSSLFQDQLEQMPIFAKFLPIYHKNKPLKGYKIVIAHVLVPNTLPLIVCAILGGADVTITASNPRVVDDSVIEFLDQLNCTLDVDLTDASNFDLAIDCNALFVDAPPKLGVVEVTRSGIHKYANKIIDRIIINADASKTKLIETFLGNPKSVLRAIKKFIGEPEEFLKNKTVAVIGFGKIGRGIAKEFQTYCTLLVCDIADKALTKAGELGLSIVKITDDKWKNSRALVNTDIIITCTGHKNLVSNYFVKEFIQGKLLLNLGAEDEYGPDYSESEVFMSKTKPFNFNLNPPTENMYIDPILFAHLSGLKYIIDGSHPAGVHPLPEELDNSIVDMFRELNNASVAEIEAYFEF
ncbi:MAG: hypothetical protein IH840_09995 [Candidatus Heimdallarchaeota archaeon]|nr:hypothetical protein [Candidatus Heimdallarchaeota archaeon]